MTRWAHRHLPRCFASRNASATRSSAGPSYGLPGQPATPAAASHQVDWFYSALWTGFTPPLTEQIGKQTDPLARQIEFARPYLVQPLEREDLDSFSRAVVETFKSRLSHWTVAKLDDGHPVIGEVPGRPDLPFNEYGYWTLMAKRGVDAEIILTNQLVASVEYIPIPVHTSIRGGITGGFY